MERQRAGCDSPVTVTVMGHLHGPRITSDVLQGVCGALGRAARVSGVQKDLPGVPRRLPGCVRQILRWLRVAEVSSLKRETSKAR